MSKLSIVKAFHACENCGRLIKGEYNNICLYCNFNHTSSDPRVSHDSAVEADKWISNPLSRVISREVRL